MIVSRVHMGCMGFGDAGQGRHAWTLDEEDLHPAGRAAGIMDSDGSVCKADCEMANTTPRTGDGQMLICVGGRDYSQEWGEAPWK